MNRWHKVILVALRIAIGWHFLYEGLFKIDSDTGSAAYATARYSLQSSTARLHDYFKQIEPGSMKLEPALARVDTWNDEIVKSLSARKALGEDQKARLTGLRDAVKIAVAETIRGTAPVEDVVQFDWFYVHEEVLKVAPNPESERFSSRPYLQASAGPLRPLFRALLPDMDGLERLTPIPAQQRIDERYRQILDHFASAGKPFTAAQEKKLDAARNAIKASVAAMLADPAFRTRLDDYRTMRNRAGVQASDLHVPFTRERLDADRKKLDLISGELLDFVNEPLLEMAVQAETIATVDQLGAGPIPRPRDAGEWVDTFIKWGLTAIGVCLLLGLLTPVAALAAAVQLAIFYLASPPFPGLPAASMGGHYLYVDRNLIEMIAALAVATAATGRWAGLDRYLYRLIERKLPWSSTISSAKSEETISTMP